MTATATTGTAQARGRGRAIYLQSGGLPVFAELHAADDGPSQNVVLLCAPFGWDELCTHRTMRAWADALAQSGHHALRFDLPGTGDSGGTPDDAGLVERWCAAVTDASAWLRETHAAPRVVAIGIGLGGILATRALADGAPIDDLILWGAPARGSSLVREMRAFATVAGGNRAPIGGYDPRTVDDGSLEAAGFLLRPQTVLDLEGLDLTALAIPDPSGRRVLLLGRDQLPPDRRLVAHLEQSGVALACEDGEGYGAMVTHPQQAKRPLAVIARTVEWIGERQPGAPRRRPPAATRSALETAVLDGGVVESPFEVEYAGRRLTGVLTDSARGPRSEVPVCAVLSIAGAIRRIGPNRMWVEAARRWAALGVPTLRFDAVGLGDSDGDEEPYENNREFYLPSGPEQVLTILDALQGAGFPGRFVVGGLCSGAYWGYHAARLDTRVRGLLLINLFAFEWSEEVVEARERVHLKAKLSRSSLADITRIASGRSRMRPMAAVRAIPGVLLPRSARLRDRPIREALATLAARDVETLMLFSAGEPLLEELSRGGWLGRLGEWPNMTLERIPIRDHTFQPAWAQRFVHERLDEALMRSIGRAAGAH